MRANGLNVAVVGLAQLTSGLEVLLAGPASRQDRQRQCNLDGRHCAVCSWWGSRTARMEEKVEGRALVYRTVGRPP